MAEAKDRNIFQRMAEIRATDAVQYMKRDARILGYTAITHDAVTANTRDAFLKAGVHVSTSLEDSALIDTGKIDKGGSKVFMYKALYRIEFINIDNPGDRYTVMHESLALDNGDKHAGKACSMAKKYAILKECGIETGDNEESRAPENAKKATREEIDSIEILCQSLGVPFEIASQRILKGFQISDLSEMTSGHVVQAREWITAAAARKISGAGNQGGAGNGGVAVGKDGKVDGKPTRGRTSPKDN